MALLNRDTSPEIERRQIDGWRQMTSAQKADVVSGLTQAAYDMALAGVRHRYPDATGREHFLRLAMITLGAGVARCAYPDIIELGLE